MGLKDWRAPTGWRRIRTIDMHTAGEPFRIIVDGGPELEGATILECRRAARERFDHLRRALMWEPRGHADMYGCIITRPFSDGADFGILFTHNEGYSSMCGHGIIAMATAAVETGMVEAVEPETTVGIDSPAGLVRAFGRVDNGRVLGVRFLNVPSFVVALDAEVEVPDLGRVRYDLAYGGAFYALVDTADLGLRCDGEHVRSLIEAGSAIKKAVAATHEIVHPFEEDLGFLYGVIFVEPSSTSGVHSRNCCVFADGEVDRSPTGTGVSARLALHFAKGEIAMGEKIVIESLIGSSFAGRVVEETTFGPHPAVVSEVSGRAHITGRHEFVLDPDDDLVHGFMLR
ncbi:MAG: proline racemase family protein [Thermoanaerobaculales bacterium]|jgi:trans-L-3-hydroxyproline dehydratase|nr:proline racemase family protein [Thermoanaerobaculales bacterium]